MIAHDRFAIEKTLKAPPEKVWRAFTDPGQKRVWFVDMDEPGWETLDYGCDPRVGGREHGRFRHKGVVHGNETVYLDRAERERLVFAYTMGMDGRRHSASLGTVELAAVGGGTRLT